MRLSREQGAKIGITIQFLALVRLLAEYFRLLHIHYQHLALATVQPFILGALLTAVLVWLSVTLFFFRRYTGAMIVSAATVVLLLLYKFLLMP